MTGVTLSRPFAGGLLLQAPEACPLLLQLDGWAELVPFEYPGLIHYWMEKPHLNAHLLL